MHEVILSKSSELLVANLRTDGLQIRPALDRQNVAHLVDVLKNGGKFKDKVIVYKDAAGTYWVADGHHRLRACDEAGVRNVTCEVRKGEFIDAFRLALGANSDHGLKRDDATVKNAIMKAYDSRAKLWPDATEMPSARLIADTVHCSPDYANRQLSTVDSWKAATKRTGADGKTRTVPPPRQPVPKPNTTTTVPPPPEPAQAVPVASVPPPLAPKPEPPAAQVDAVGREIPDYLRDEWNANTATLKQCEQELQRIERLIENDVMAARAVFHEKSHQAATAAVRTLLGEIRRCIPYAICPYCRAAEPMQAGCKACGSVGYVGKHRWDTAMPEAMKA